MIVDETSTGCGKTVITKDAMIKKGKFEVEQNGFGVGGVWITKGNPEAGIAGGTQGDCRGSDPSGKKNVFSAFLGDYRTAPAPLHSGARSDPSASSRHRPRATASLSAAPPIDVPQIAAQVARRRWAVLVSNQ